MDIIIEPMESSKAEEYMPLAANTVVSNVPGPPIPLYMCGARVESIIPYGPILFGIGSNITVLSYVDKIAFGVMVDPHLVPEPWYLNEGFELGLKALERSLPDKSGEGAATVTKMKVAKSVKKPAPDTRAVE